ncbi:MAG TPA: HNH endonuclease [Pyrinomonadaceae bacterium]|nr:HNH endonuclease [Pyrinomonadaceae bacterium]
MLTVELVPRTSWFKNVRSHVPAAEWERLKKLTFGRAGYRCEVCGGRGPRWPVECHEVFSYDDARRVQRLERLVALCPACHETKHIGLAGLRGRRAPAVAHLARVNGWSIADAELYLEACFEQWHRRSCHEWQLDLSYLERLGVAVGGEGDGAGEARMSEPS